MTARPSVVLGAGLVAGLLAFGGAYWWQTHPRPEPHTGAPSELAWLRYEFALTDAQFARIATLHSEYRPTCAELCRRIAENNRRLQEAVLATNTVTPEIRTLLAETGRVRDDCRAAMLAHLYAVSREMSPEQGRRYLDSMLRETCVAQSPRSIETVHSQHDHHGP